VAIVSHSKIAIQAAAAFQSPFGGDDSSRLPALFRLSVVDIQRAFSLTKRVIPFDHVGIGDSFASQPSSDVRYMFVYQPIFVCFDAVCLSRCVVTINILFPSA
jgi:hypothetical protein